MPHENSLPATFHRFATVSVSEGTNVCSQDRPDRQQDVVLYGFKRNHRIVDDSINSAGIHIYKMSTLAGLVNIETDGLTCARCLSAYLPITKYEDEH